MIRQEILGIQYLRGLAAIMVVGHHIVFQWQMMTGAGIQSALASGVDIFFIISGFVMVYSTNGGQISPTTFLRRRLVRIVPLYWAATLFLVSMCLLLPQFVKSIQLSWPHALASLAFVAARNPAVSLYGPLGYGPIIPAGWTLNLEMLFYILFFASIMIAKGRLMLLLFVLAIPLGMLAGIGLVTTGRGWFSFYTQDIILEFWMGAALGAIWLRRPTYIWPPLGIILIVIALSFLLMLPLGDHDLRILRFGLTASAIVALGVATIVPRLRLPHLLGDTSYSLYLSHLFVLSATVQLWKRLGLQHLPFSAFCATLLLSAILGGYLCWRFVEVPLTRCVQKLVGRRAAPVSLRSN